MLEENVGIFPHKCSDFDCKCIVEFDDEPYCYVHSPDSGSSVEGYSAREQQKNVPIKYCECMYTQNESGDSVCYRCHGDIYSCECPLIHSRMCPNNDKEKE